MAHGLIKTSAKSWYLTNHFSLTLLCASDNRDCYVGSRLDYFWTRWFQRNPNLNLFWFLMDIYKFPICIFYGYLPISQSMILYIPIYCKYSSDTHALWYSYFNLVPFHWYFLLKIYQNTQSGKTLSGPSIQDWHVPNL